MKSGIAYSFMKKSLPPSSVADTPFDGDHGVAEYQVTCDDVTWRRPTTRHSQWCNFCPLSDVSMIQYFRRRLIRTGQSRNPAQTIKATWRIRVAERIALVVFWRSLEGCDGTTLVLVAEAAGGAKFVDILGDGSLDSCVQDLFRGCGRQLFLAESQWNEPITS